MSLNFKHKEVKIIVELFIKKCHEFGLENPIIDFIDENQPMTATDMFKHLSTNIAPKTDCIMLGIESDNNTLNFVYLSTFKKHGLLLENTFNDFSKFYNELKACIKDAVKQLQALNN